MTEIRQELFEELLPVVPGLLEERTRSLWEPIRLLWSRLFFGSFSNTLDGAHLVALGTTCLVRTLVPIGPGFANFNPEAIAYASQRGMRLTDDVDSKSNRVALTIALQRQLASLSFDQPDVGRGGTL